MKEKVGGGIVIRGKVGRGKVKRRKVRRGKVKYEEKKEKEEKEKKKEEKRLKKMIQIDFWNRRQYSKWERFSNIFERQSFLAFQKVI